MHVTLPRTIFLSLLLACGETDEAKDSDLDPTDADLVETDEPSDEPEADPITSLQIDAESAISADLYPYDNKLQFLRGTESVQISVDVEPAGAEITWSSSKPGVVEVSATGELTLKKEGAVELTVSAGELSDSVVVEVGDSIARGQFSLNEQRFGTSSGSEGGEGGIEVFDSIFRTSAAAEAPSTDTGVTAPPTPLTVRQTYCGGSMIGGFPSGYANSWKPTSLFFGFNASYSVGFCNAEPQYSGPYVLTAPLEISSSEDAALDNTEGDISDTASPWASENSVCSMSLEGHNGFLWKDVTFPDHDSTLIFVQARAAANLSSAMGLEISVTDHETGELIASSHNVPNSLSQDYFAGVTVELYSESSLRNRSVDLWFDVTGTPNVHTAHGQPNLWFDDIEILTTAPSTPTETATKVVFSSVATEPCDTLDHLTSLQMFEPRSLTFETTINGFGTAERRITVPHDQSETYVRYVDTFTNTSGEVKAGQVNYEAGYQILTSQSPLHYFLTNQRGYLRTPVESPSSLYYSPSSAAVALIVGEDYTLYENEGSVTAGVEINLSNGESVALLSFEPLSSYKGGYGSTEDAANLEARMEAIITSFASDPLSSPYAEGITAEQWSLIQGWSNPEPLTPVDEDTGAL